MDLELKEFIIYSIKKVEEILNFINNLNHLDLLILVVTIVSMIYGYMRGLVKEILSIISIFFSGYISTILYPNISFFLKEYIDMKLLADTISFVILFVIIYSSVNIFSNIIIVNLYKTPLKIFDKNFGIIFGFFRSLLIFSLLNILFSWIIWKKNIPYWLENSKSMILLDYTSNKILNVLPEENLKKIKEIFGISLNSSTNNLQKNRNEIEKYNEPAIINSPEGSTKGYTDNDNDSLNKLFNIESAE